MTPALFQEIYRTKAREKIASDAGSPQPDQLVAEKVALWQRLKAHGALDPRGAEVGVAKIAAEFAARCINQGEKLASNEDPIARCVSIGTAVRVDGMIDSLLKTGAILPEEAAFLGTTNAECALFELGLLTTG